VGCDENVQFESVSAQKADCTRSIDVLMCIFGTYPDFDWDVCLAIF